MYKRIQIAEKFMASVLPSLKCSTLRATPLPKCSTTTSEPIQAVSYFRKRIPYWKKQRKPYFRISPRGFFQFSGLRIFTCKSKQTLPLRMITINQKIYYITPLYYTQSPVQYGAFGNYLITPNSKL